MRPPCEVVVRRLLPILRALVAKELMATYGWTQSRTARRLGVTQPAVSTYLSLLDKDSTQRLDMEELNAAARRIAAGMATGGLTLSETVMNVCELCISLKSGGIVCTLHKWRVPELRRESCEACLHLFGRGIKQVEERYEVLSNLKRAVALVEECDEFTAVMP
ncbi:MAG: transcriptional regulator, partial [Candidatus Bathyarchaeia archaeon]